MSRSHPTFRSAKVNMDFDQHREKPKPHDFLWFHDGNVVLATDTCLFKVHKTLLSLHSSVFRDMFDFPTIESTGEECPAEDMYEGLPLVRLADDEGDDVAHILRAIYEYKYYDCHNDNTPIDVVSALLVLSTKYDFKDVRKDVFFQISQHYPMTLKDFDSSEDNMIIFGEHRSACNEPLLLAALDANADCLLPTLFFVCSDFYVEDLFDLYPTISPECERTLIKGRAQLEAKVAKFVAGLPEDLLVAAQTCNCLRVNGLHCLQIARYTRLHLLVNTSLWATKGLKVVKEHLTPVCEQCSLFLADRINREREKIWDDVPSCFGLPKWDVLKDRLKEVTEA